MLAYSKEYKKSQAQCALYYKEKDPTSTSIVVEDGYKQRYDLTKQSKTFEMIGRPFSDIFFQTRYIIPGIDVRVQFHRSPEEFCLFAPIDAIFIVDIQEARLIVQKHTLLPSIQVSHLQMWESGRPISYPMRKVEIKTYTLAPGTVQSTNENLICGLLPDGVIIGFTSSVAHMGSIQTNPYNFEHFGIKYIDVSINGDQPTALPIHLDWDSDQYIQSYYNIFGGLGIANDDIGLEVTREEFKNGKALFVYDLRHVRESFATPKYGNVKIDLKFTAGLTSAVTVLVYAEYQSVLHIDKNKSVYFKDYSSI